LKNIVVTGGAGFIGSHTCLALLQKGYEIYSIDSYINSSPESLKRVEQLFSKNKNFKNRLNTFKGDLRDEYFLKEVFENALKDGRNIDGVIHFAGLKSVRNSVLDPISYWDANVNSTISLLKIMNKYDCKTIVFSSSATIYGKLVKRNLDEKCPLDPINPYGFTKMVIEKFLGNVYKTPESDWRIANLRYFNPIGSHNSGLIGENPLGIPNNIFPYITNVALGNFKELKIFGDDWPTKDGTGIRDYIHVMDLAEGHVRTLEFLLDNKSQLLNMNIGTGNGISVLDLVKTFEAVNNIKIPYKFVSRREGDVARLVADNTILKSNLKWEPRKTLKDMCIDGWRWQSSNPNGY
tara:strand:+ start:323 stop:1372 length:1050 start_codon:yes stop_codon:yes gene_type:complete